MKKYQCLVCGFDINESDVKCSNCNSIIDMDIITSKDPIKTIKHTIKINFLNNEYKKNISLLEKTDNELLLEYYKMFSYKEQFSSNIHTGIMGYIVLSSVGDSVNVDVETNKAGRPRGVIINFKNITRNLGYVYENT